MDSAHALDYAPRESRPQKLWRWAWKISTILAIIAAAIFWGPGLYRWGNFLYWQQRCMTYTAPRNTIIASIHLSPQVSSAMNPDPPSLLNAINGVGLRVDNGPTLFMHELRQPDGKMHLVWVCVDGMVEQFSPLNEGSVALTVQTYNPLPNHRFLLDPSNGGVQTTLLPHSNVNDLQIFAGEADPANLSHFTFEYQSQGQHCVVDCWLQNNGKLLIAPPP